jgi:hypothetical protein
MREYIEEIKPKLLKIIPDIEDQKADSNTKKSRRPKSTKTTRK